MYKGSELLTLIHLHHRTRIHFHLLRSRLSDLFGHPTQIGQSHHKYVQISKCLRIAVLIVPSRTHKMHISALFSAVFIGAALAAKSCRQCDCTFTWSKADPRPRIAPSSQAQVQSKAERWLDLYVANSDYEDFSIKPAVGASCPADTSLPCDSYTADFKAWRLCQNGGSFVCSQDDDGGNYNMKCSCTQSVDCRGNCQKGCPALPN